MFAKFEVRRLDLPAARFRHVDWLVLEGGFVQGIHLF